VTGAGFADNLQFRWNNGEAFMLHCKAVANRLVESGRIEIRSDAFAKDAVEGFGQWNGLNGRAFRPRTPGCYGQDNLDAALNCDHLLS
jgi:hypothetical protein